MKKIGLVRSAVPPHGRHAITTGTDSSGDGARIVTRHRSEFGKPRSIKMMFCRGLKIDVRQGIARMRGHVAPARSLC